MTIFARFKAIDENRKAAVVRRLIENSTPDFDFFYFVALATLMATLGLLADNAVIIIGSMLIAPILSPILGVALGLVMSDQKVLGRSLLTLGKAFGLGILVSVGATLIFSEQSELTAQTLLRADVSLISFIVAIVAGLAVSYALARAELNEALPGVAVAVSLIPPLAVVGIGIAHFDFVVILGSLKLLTANVVGIIFAAMTSFSLMDLYTKRHIADSTIDKEDERVEIENKMVTELANHKDEGVKNIPIYE